METISKADQDARDEILESQCPHCKTGLLPKLPQDPNKVFFRDGRIRYLKWCAGCKTLVT